MRAAVSMLPTKTLPRPQRPAATAACIASGAPANVIRVAIALGVRPCSTKVTAMALKTMDSSAVGTAVHQLQKGHVAERELAEQLVAQVVALDEDAVGRGPGEVGTKRLARGHREGSTFDV